MGRLLPVREKSGCATGGVERKNDLITHEGEGLSYNQKTKRNKEKDDESRTYQKKKHFAT